MCIYPDKIRSFSQSDSSLTQGIGTRPERKKSRARRRRWQGEYHEAKGFRFYLVDDERVE